MAQKKMTIKEIARIAGVSPTSVSFVINGRNGVSQATRDKVLSVIKETDFYPSVASQRLTFQKSFNIAMIYPVSASPFTDLFYYEIANGLTEALTAQNYNVVFTPLQQQAQNGYELPTIIKRRDADGAVLLQSIDPALLNDLDDYGIPHVLVDWQSEEKGRTNISIDVERSIYHAMMYLIDHGHTKIGFWGSDQFPYYYLRCFGGYQNALMDKKINLYPGWIQSSIHSEETAADCVRKVLLSENPPTAICCTSDMCAIRAIRAATASGLRVPEDVSFISIDNILISQYIQPSLTTVSYEKSQIGKMAASLLLRKIAGEETENAVIVGDSIIERQSVCTIK